MITSLDRARENEVCQIVNVLHDKSSPMSIERARQLQELGFIRGEQVVLLRRTQPGSDPLVVRIGSATFALRRSEAECIEIETSPAYA